MSDYEDQRRDQYAKLIPKGLFIDKVTRPITLDTDPQDGFEFIYKSRLEDACLDYGPKTEPNVAKDKDKKTSTNDLIAWGREQGLHFTRLAHKIKKNRKSLMQKFQKTVEFPELPRNPSDLDEKEWCTFCLGSVMCAKIFGGDSPCGIVKAHKPLLSIVLHLDRRQLLQLICWHHKWFQSASRVGDSEAHLVDAICMWTYALCCNLHKPLDSVYEKQLETLHDSYKEAVDTFAVSGRDRVYLIVAILKHYYGVKYHENSTSWNTYIDASYYCPPSSSSSEYSD